MSALHTMKVKAQKRFDAIKLLRQPSSLTRPRAEQMTEECVQNTIESTIQYAIHNTQYTTYNILSTEYGIQYKIVVAYG